MAEEYLTDDEQLENIKRLVIENGPAVIGGVVLALAIVFGWRYYHGRENDRALEAAAQYGQMMTSLQQNDHAKARQQAGELIKNFPKSPYADQSKLAVARMAVDDGQEANAIAPLTDVMNTSKDSELQRIARLRLARVLIDQGKPDEALQLLADASGSFAERVHEVRGDAFFAKKDLKQASSEYAAALSAAGFGNSVDSALLQLKMADLGLPGPSAPAMSMKPMLPGAPVPGAPATTASQAPATAPSNKATP